MYGHLEEEIVFNDGAVKQEGVQPTVAHLATAEAMLVDVQQLEQQAS